MKQCFQNLKADPLKTYVECKWNQISEFVLRDS